MILNRLRNLVDADVGRPSRSVIARAPFRTQSYARALPHGCCIASSSSRSAFEQSSQRWRIYGAPVWAFRVDLPQAGLRAAPCPILSLRRLPLPLPPAAAPGSRPSPRPATPRNSLYCNAGAAIWRSIRSSIDVAAEQANVSQNVSHFCKEILPVGKKPHRGRLVDIFAGSVSPPITPLDDYCSNEYCRSVDESPGPAELRPKPGSCPEEATHLEMLHWC
jgi:hypothetical protein